MNSANEKNELALQAKGVVVKPLEWNGTSFLWEVPTALGSYRIRTVLWEAPTALGSYKIRTVAGLPNSFEVSTPSGYLCMANSLDEAKAAAEAVYQHDSTAPAGEVVTDAMVERALGAWWDADPGPTDTSYREAMRAAITAAITEDK